LAEPLSIYQLIAEATLLVQLVMLTLVLASIVSWVMIFQRFFALNSIEKAIDDFEEYFWSGIDLNQLYSELESSDAPLSGIESMFVAAFKEYGRLSAQSGADAEALMQGVQRALRVSMTREHENLSTHLPFLATVGSTSPYIGLFGTVWGIMNSFRALATMGQATLAAVAPGISEALIATAMGLFAAIPAVIAYNRFSARADILLNRYNTFAEEFVSILHRAAHVK
jgi:biopolymer transport protein TolQ